jgi:hypothetical protein
VAAGLVLLSSVAVAGTRPVVVELFTSEGCSSCPPADALLNTFVERRDVLPLAFHVTYWNALGWRDPYSFEAATSRQTLYAARLGGGIYTPEMVVDGRRGVVGSETESVVGAIATARQETSSPVAVNIVSTNGSLSVSVGGGAGHGRIMLVGFDPHHETRVDRGENSGRVLVESNIVRSMSTIGEYDGAPVTLKVERGAGADAAVILQAPDGHILGVGRL